MVGLFCGNASACFVDDLCVDDRHATCHVLHFLFTFPCLEEKDEFSSLTSLKGVLSGHYCSPNGSRNTGF